MRRRLAQALNLREGESDRVGRLFAFIFLLTAAAVCAKSAQRGLFLAAYPRERIPDAFLLSSVLLAVTSLGASALAARWGLERLVRSLLLFSAAALVAARLLLHVLPWAPMGLYVVVELTFNLLLVQGWAIAAEALDVRSAKRLLPLISSGAGVAWTVGGFAATSVAARLGADGLLLVGAGLLALCWGVLLQIIRRDLPAAPSRRAAQTGLLAGTAEGLQYIVRQPLMRVLAVIITLDLLVEQVTEFQLFAFAQQQFSGVPGGIAAFMGAYYGLTGAIILAAPFVYSSRVLSRFGSTQSMMVSPGWLIAGAAVVLAVPSFAALVLLAGGDRILKQTLSAPARSQIFTAVPAVRRAQAGAILRGVLASAFGALGAVALKAVPPGMPVQWLAVATLAMAAVILWVVGTSLKKGYLDALQRSVDQRRLDLDAPGSSQLRALDREQYLLLDQELKASDPDRAGFAVSLIASGEPSAAQALLRGGLAHPSPDIRARVAESLAALGAVSESAAIAALLPGAEQDGLRCALLRALARLGAWQTAPQVASLRTAANPKVRALCLACLARFEELAQRPLPEAAGALAELEALLTSAEDEERAAVAWALGEIPLDFPKLRERFTSLMQDASFVVRREAVGASGGFDDPAILERLLLALGEPATSRAAFDAFARLQRAGLERVEELIKEAPASVVSQTAAALGRGATVEATALLGRMLGHDDEQVRYRAARALALRRKLRGWVPPAEDLVRRVVQAELEKGYRYYAALVALSAATATAEQARTADYLFLSGEIDSRIRQTEKRLLALLALASEQRIGRMAHVLHDSRPQVAARAMELLEQSLSRELAAQVVPFLEQESQLRARGPAADGSKPAAEDPLPGLISLGDDHLRRCAALALKDRMAREYPDVLQQEAPMLHLVERIRFLRKVPLFGQLSPEDLMKLAEIADPVDLRAKAVVFRKGDPGDFLCVLVAGRVEIRDGTHVIASQGPNEFFGELAVLDDEPRSADAVCTQDTSLLQIGGADLDELMERRPEIAREVIRVLAKRLRATTQQMITAESTRPAAAASTRG